jgi:hypothetical protein
MFTVKTISLRMPFMVKTVAYLAPSPPHTHTTHTNREMPPGVRVGLLVYYKSRITTGGLNISCPRLNEKPGDLPACLVLRRPLPLKRVCGF